MNELTALAAVLANCDPAEVTAARRTPDGGLAVIVDRGILGSPKLTFTAEQVAQAMGAPLEKITPIQAKPPKPAKQPKAK